MAMQSSNIQCSTYIIACFSITGPYKLSRKENFVLKNSITSVFIATPLRLSKVKLCINAIPSSSYSSIDWSKSEESISETKIFLNSVLN